ncbi:hypothetical protein PCANB_000466 [Pneumocystis canis]|nr:hypothetical protein PCANB_000466 [Pneumocystis canis]
MFQIHKKNRHLPTLKKILLGAVVTLMSKTFGKCISLAGSKSCPSFDTSLISTTVTIFPSLSLIEDLQDFDKYLESYIYKEDKYKNFYGCSLENELNTDLFYARYTKTILCASLVQESITECNLTTANSLPACADTCLGWLNSIICILQYHCTNKTLENIISLIRADFTLCTSPNASFSPECVRGSFNEPENCGFGTNILGLCQYCNSFSSNSIDTCCLISNLSQCAIFNYPTSVSLPAYITSSFPTTTTSNTISSDSLSTTLINENKQNKSISTGPSQKTVSLIIVLSIIIVLIILLLLISLIFLSCNRRKKIKNITSKQSNGLRQPFSRKNDLHKNCTLPFFKAANNSNVIDYNTTSTEKDPHYFDKTTITNIPEKRLSSEDNENKQTKSYNFYNVTNLNKNHKFYQNATSFSLNFKSHTILNHHASKINGNNPEDNPEDTNIIAFRNSKSRPTSSIGEDRSAILPITISMKDYYSDHQITRNTEVVALYIYEPKMPDEMILEKGDLIHVISVWDDGWCSGIKIGKLNHSNPKKSNISESNIKYLGNNDKNISESKEEFQTDELIIKVFPLVCVCHKDSWKEINESNISPSSTLRSTSQNITHQIFNTSKNNDILLKPDEKNIKFLSLKHDTKITKETRRKSFPEILSLTNSEGSDNEWSISFLNTFNHEKEKNIHLKMNNTIRWGWFLLISTWLLFVTGMSGIFGIWQWVFQIKDVKDQEKSYDFPIIDYYFLLIILTGGVIVWIWVGINWLGLKYFRMTETKGDP